MTLNDRQKRRVRRNSEWELEMHKAEYLKVGGMNNNITRLESTKKKPHVKTASWATGPQSDECGFARSLSLSSVEAP